MRTLLERLHAQDGMPTRNKTIAEAADIIESQQKALENCRLLAARHRKEPWALLILGFCAEAGVVGSVMRG